jgi:hypothetical protein
VDAEKYLYFFGFYLTPAGPLTWNALMPMCYGRPMPPYPGYLMRIGVRGDGVRQVQSCLNNVQNAGLATDGIFGPLTDAAVRNYQRANGLTVDGIVGPITWEHLMRRCGFTPVASPRGTVGVPMETPEAVQRNAAGVEWIGEPTDEMPEIGLGNHVMYDDANNNEDIPMPEPAHPVPPLPVEPITPLPAPLPIPEPAHPVPPLPVEPIVPIPAPLPMPEPPAEQPFPVPMPLPAHPVSPLPIKPIIPLPAPLPEPLPAPLPAPPLHIDMGFDIENLDFEHILTLYLLKIMKKR